MRWIVCGIAAAALGGVLLIGIACSGGSSNDGTASGSCEAAFRAHCKRACECAPGPECVFAGGVIQTDAGTQIFLGTIVKDEEACNSFVTSECANGGDPKGDYPVCEEKSKTAACIDNQLDDGGTITGVEPLAECNFN